MHYTAERLDRSTGELKEVSLGQWITVTELGEHYQVGPKQIRAILHHMGLLQQERSRYRLTPLAVERGLGKRIDKPRRSKWPFDVISPLGQNLVASVWHETVADLEAEKEAECGVTAARAGLAAFQATRRAELTTQEAVCWLLDHFSKLTHDQIALLLDVARPLVTRYAVQRAKQLDFLTRKRATEPPSTPSQPGRGKAISGPSNPFPMPSTERN